MNDRSHIFQGTRLSYKGRLLNKRLFSKEGQIFIVSYMPQIGVTAALYTAALVCIGLEFYAIHCEDRVLFLRSVLLFNVFYWWAHFLG